MDSGTAMALFPEGTALFSPCKRYRYVLTRRWNYDPPAVFIGLNPSTADEDVDDPTIRRCTAFARQWGCGGLTMLNLFAWRATDPRELLAATDPAGPDNDHHIVDQTRLAGIVIAAWGAHRMAAARGRIRPIVGAAARTLYCLGTTRDGSPRHPLYVPSSQQAVPWP